MELLFDRWGDKTPITEEVVKAAAGNDRDGGKIVELLRDRGEGYLYEL